MVSDPHRSASLFARLLDDRGAEMADRPALQHGDGVWSYADLRALVLDAAQALRDCGLQAGDRVLMVLPNSPEFVASFFGITALGAVAVPIDFNAGPDRLEFVAGDTEPRFCLRTPSRELGDDFPVPHHSVVIEPGARKYGLDRAPARGTDAAASLSCAGPDSPAVILYSAGSTGRPKGAVLEHGQLLTIARTLVGVVKMGRDHRDMILSPMTHSGGWQRVTSTMLAGGCAVIPEGPFSVPALLEDVEELDIHGFFASPPVLRVLMLTDADRVRKATSGLRSIESASAPLAPAELQKLMDLLPGTEVYWQYGLTECSRAFILDVRKHPDKLDTVGLPTAGVEVSIADDHGADVGCGTKGEIQLAAAQLTNRYWNRPDLARERFRGKWLRTGDIGSVDEDGFLTYHGRADDMINCGGLSFFPGEVENELGPVGGVTAYLVAGVPDPQGLLGQVPWIFVVPAEPEGWSPKELVALARKRLPPHMVPRRVVTMPEMPLMGSGKPSRRRVLELYAPQPPEQPPHG